MVFGPRVIISTHSGRKTEALRRLQINHFFIFLKQKTYCGQRVGKQRTEKQSPEKDMSKGDKDPRK